MKQKQTETTTDTSSGRSLILADPTALPYETAWETMLRNMEQQKDDDDLLAWQLEQGLIDMHPTTNTNDEKKFQALVFKDHLLKFPELYLQVAIIGPGLDARGFPALFARAFCEGASSLEDADLAVFTGGPDVDPAYYGEEKISNYYGNEERDFEDINAYMTCLEQGIPMLGVCRGAQFLAAMNQYKLVQDLDNHQTDHKIWDVRGHFYLDKVSSLHHQSVIPGPGMDVLATATESTVKVLNPKIKLEKSKTQANFWSPDVEAFFIRSTCCIGIQGHPEYKNYNAFSKWSMELVQEFVNLNEDVDWENSRRRLKKEFRDEIALINGVKPKAKPKLERKILTSNTVKEN